MPLVLLGQHPRAVRYRMFSFQASGLPGLIRGEDARHVVLHHLENGSRMDNHVVDRLPVVGGGGSPPAALEVAGVFSVMVLETAAGATRMIACRCRFQRP